MKVNQKCSCQGVYALFSPFFFFGDAAELPKRIEWYHCEFVQWIVKINAYGFSISTCGFRRKLCENLLERKSRDSNIITLGMFREDVDPCRIREYTIKSLTKRKIKSAYFPTVCSYVSILRIPFQKSQHDVFSPFEELENNCTINLIFLGKKW